MILPRWPPFWYYFICDARRHVSTARLTLLLLAESNGEEYVQNTFDGLEN